MIKEPIAGNIYYGLIDNKVKKCMWWNRKTMHCPGYTDLVTLNLKLPTEKGTILEEKDRIYINREYLFETKKEAKDFYLVTNK